MRETQTTETSARLDASQASSDERRADEARNSSPSNAGRTTVGEFTYDETTGNVTGPATYMRERFPEVAREIEAGRNVVFNHGAGGLSPNVATALLVAIQTDYAGWKGSRDFMRRLQR